MSRLEVERASVAYGDVAVLKGVSFDVNEGEFVTLLGPSGCGKTTLLRAIAGFVPLDGGHIRIGGREMNGLEPEKRNTAMCFQSYALFPHLTVSENIAFGLQQRKIPREALSHRVVETALTVAMAGHLDKLPTQLSGGQQQRVALARSMAVRPDVMLFDEPLSNLDARLREQLRLQIRALQRKHGFTAVYVTHDQAEALAMSDKVVVMHGGSVIQSGTPQEIYHRPVNRFVADFIGTANIMVGTVTARDGDAGQYRVATALGEFTVASDEPPAQQRVYLCWRPENACLLSLPALGQNIFSLRVKRQTFLGNLTDVEGYHQDTDNVHYRIQLLGYQPLLEGETYYFSLAPGALRFLREAVAA
ncbi:ABC transporter ATP-binding protein [Dickeya fangzhongdai]|uniref:ABC transporter ATP-binding protein n=1 Tax=Dickeya fangzhongdai TaxID=1778540 RepID=A0A2K8QM28_9GAMM|nr:ABC transporter ATP-binding protein [Dickeya fangzhongdai]ATZ94534.1 ABC transporter ATP-binding protein [Dickeya fangzhongdai]MBO8134204.1 ABC transporter ATP-binding protein [Dickeya fangzhongdai]QOH47972.1 ABC transporter ATP-binding protein [Dickeya fangzhongdai]QOH52277.1 ABC transporter ATP-binding protein [Dickeya fangzhongdai]WES88221.1 ABC transporter ATP-binding protein [Dickeya fangzhongdai]